MFKRRTPRTQIERVKEAVLPSMGWRRTATYHKHRMFRNGDSAHKITAGIASGVAVSFSPFLGTHLLQAVGLGLLLRANLIAAFAGTLIGNPWTLPFFFYAGYKLGIAICAQFGMAGFLAAPKGLQGFDMLEYLFAHPVQLMLPLTVGGYICGTAAWFVSYAIFYFPVMQTAKIYQRRRLLRSYRNAVDDDADEASLT